MTVTYQSFVIDAFKALSNPSHGFVV